MPRNLAVTGASTGFGRELARQAVARGWNVYGTVRNDTAADALRSEGIEPLRLDICDATSVADFAAELTDRCGGRLDVLINNAGTAYPGPVELIGRDDLRAQFEVNVVGQIDVTAHLLDALRAAHGHIVFISSDSARITPPLVGAYAASKRALEALAEALAIEVGDQGVRVTVVEPGPFATAIWDTSLPRGDRFETGDHPYRKLAAKGRTAARLQPQGDPADAARRILDTLDRRRTPFIVHVPRSGIVRRALRAAISGRTYQRLIRLGLRFVPADRSASDAAAAD